MTTYYHLYGTGLITSSDILFTCDTEQPIDYSRLPNRFNRGEILVCNIDTLERAIGLALAFDLTAIVSHSNTTQDAVSPVTTDDTDDYITVLSRVEG
ncbi:MAG: hypothetical protein ACK5RE_17965 [Pseudanabaena sp.]|jgi:hypothetical protein